MFALRHALTQRDLIFALVTQVLNIKIFIDERVIFCA